MLEKIKQELKTKILGKNIKYFTEIDSTQDEAKKLADNNVENGTIVIAENQTKGKGTHDRKWHAEEGKNILFTLILYPECKIEKLKTITVDIAKCMIEAVNNVYKCKLDIKDPNDIMCNGKKIGGVLTQIVSSGEKIKYLLIGIGFNVNQEKFTGEIQEIATSLKKEFWKDLKNKFSQEIKRKKIIAEFCNVFEKYCISNGIVGTRGRSFCLKNGTRGHTFFVLIF